MTVILIISALFFGCGLLLQTVFCVYSRLKFKISLKAFSLVTVFCFSGFMLFQLVSLFCGQNFFNFVLLMLLGGLGYAVTVLLYLLIKPKIKIGVNLSCGQEWLNLSYLLTLSERVSRFSLEEKEQEFVQNFTQKIRRMTGNYCYEVPTGTETAEFYRICRRVGVIV